LLNEKLKNSIKKVQIKKNPIKKEKEHELKKKKRFEVIHYAYELCFHLKCFNIFING